MQATEHTHLSREEFYSKKIIKRRIRLPRTCCNNNACISYEIGWVKTQGMKIQYNLHVCINLLYEIGWVIELGHNSRNEDPIQSAYVYKLDVHIFDFLY